MKQYREQFAVYWRQRSRREQGLLAAMALVLGVGLLYAAVWEPAAKSVERNRAAVGRLQAELSYVGSLAREAEQLKRQPAQAALPAKELMPVIRQVAQSQGLNEAGWRLSPEGESGVALEGVLAFDAWVKLAGVLAAQHQVRVLSVQTEAQPMPGQVHIKALFGHAGGGA
ncbi:MULTISPECIES: type II secretion system protein GspM [Chromobacterium]|uniref:Type II secretion system protein GspM n=1 Tax=Chromobacterium aquaticum TaxID=467180 RepID=A0ABV8ZKQ9_9NEIS|nr:MULTISPECIES: type II secretion system protein GspM [Chromobacterium]MCD5362944.1 type II secretion system protein M [Chromobacterium aquaticum]